ncbi:hypothetical protein KM043_008260 [Ampulex compressa]|nr:hypothetical protein KM043_008260 [Ampulex compressa]
MESLVWHNRRGSKGLVDTEVDGDDEVVLLPLALLLVLPGLHGGGLRRYFDLSLLGRRFLRWLRRNLGARRHLLTSGQRCLLTRRAFLVHVAHSIRRFVACLPSGNEQRERERGRSALGTRQVEFRSGEKSLEEYFGFATTLRRWRQRFLTLLPTTGVLLTWGTCFRDVP